MEDKRKAKYDCWFQIHYYLARLGSWLRATNNVVQLSHNFADSLAACDVRDLPVDINNEQAPLVLERDPGKVLLRVCPNFKGTSIFYDALAKLQGACELASQYRTHTQIPIPLAETKILHFFSYKVYTLRDEIGTSAAANHHATAAGNISTTIPQGLMSAANITTRGSSGLSLRP